MLRKSKEIFFGIFVSNIVRRDIADTYMNELFLYRKLFFYIFWTVIGVMRTVLLNCFIRKNIHTILVNPNNRDELTICKPNNDPAYYLVWQYELNL